MVEVNPIGSDFVAEITAVDVRQLTDDDFERLYAAWLQYGVLRLRDQCMDEDELQTFSARFGPLEEIPFGRIPEAEKAKFTPKMLKHKVINFKCDVSGHLKSYRHETKPEKTLLKFCSKLVYDSSYLY